MAYPTSTNIFGDKECLFTWMRNVGYKDVAPVTQAYGVVFNSDGDIMICTKDPKREMWGLPGGTPEKGDQSIVDTLERELIEEVDTKVKDIVYLGVQKAEVVEDPESAVYQTRFFAVVDKLLPQTPDPDDGEVFVRKFVKPSEVNKILKWGDSGQAVIDDALEVWKKRFEPVKLRDE